MDEWEEEFEQVQSNTTQTTTTQKKVEESEDIIKKEFKPKVVEQKEAIDDYERKWQEKNKDRLEKLKLEDKAFAGLDDKTKQQKMVEKRIIDDAHDFIGGDKPTGVSKESAKDTVQLPLTTEKDFIDLAVHNVARVKAANKPTKFLFSYLKNTIDLLATSLESEKINTLVKDLNAHYNKKKKEENDKAGKKPKTTAPTILVSKAIDRAEKMGAFEDFGAAQDDYNEDDYIEDDFI
jgi:hypothetical protein